MTADQDAATERHKKKMANRKAVQDAEVSAKSIEKGLLIVHTGKGKGKSTAAWGLLLRSLGRGLRAGVVQFGKGAWETGERTAAEKFGDQVVWHTLGEGFTWETQDRARDVAAAERAWATAKDLMADPTIQILILDELNIALRYDHLDIVDVVATLQGRRPDLHIVVTGRNAKPELIEAADLVTEMGLVKHHFAAGVKAQEGIEFNPMKAVMFQGTGSDVGKSLIVAGLARAFANRGLKVRPFKPQNMSNNAATTADGGEIGRAQALQARAARVAPSVHMNPVLLKPQSEIGSQVIVQGRTIGNYPARQYQALKPKLMTAVLESFQKLGDEADLVLVEGAGSASEVNLRRSDIANMGFARAADVPVILIGDIDRGGVIASLAGTRTVIDADDAAMIAGFLVNKFRGDPALFRDGLKIVEQHAGWPALGLIPYFPNAARLPAEDALALSRSHSNGHRGQPQIVVLGYPRISNFDEFDPLRLEPGVDLVFLRPGQPIPGTASLVILPGSKATIADLAALREAGWDIDLHAHIRRGGHVLGICGGYQMLGTQLADPNGIEGAPTSVAGLGHLDVETVLDGHKILRDVSGTAVDSGAPVAGYEMHVGRTNGPACDTPLHRFSDGTLDGARSPSGRVSGCYVHGLFASDLYRAHWLGRIGSTPSGLNYEPDIDDTLDALADHLEKHVDCDRILELARTPNFRNAQITE